MLAHEMEAIREEAPDSPQQRLVMHALGMVTEIMADDVPLAEQMRMAALTIWLAERRTRDPGYAWVAWRDIQRGSEQLRRQLYRALRRGFVSYEQFDEAMNLLSRVGRQMASEEPTPVWGQC